MGFESLLGLVLRQTALEFAAAGDAIVAREANFGHLRWAVHAETPDVLGNIEKRLQQADGIEDLEGARLDFAVARASRCGRTSCSMSRASTPWRASSAAANSPEGPAPMINTSFRLNRSPGKAGKLGLAPGGSQPLIAVYAVGRRFAA